MHQTAVFWPTVSAELDRLGVPERIAERDELRKKDPLIKPFTAVDMGGAGGDLIASFLRRFPTAHGVCVDIEYQFLVRGEKRHKDLVDAGRLRFVHGSSSASTLPAESADLYSAQFVYQHLYDIQGSLQEMHRVTAPGATLLIVDADTHMHDMMWPPPPTMPLAEKLHQLHERESAASHASGMLLRFLEQALRAWGLQGVRTGVALTSSQEQGAEHYWPLLAPQQYYALVRSKSISQAFFDSAQALFDEWQRDVKDVFLMRCLAAVWTARKPQQYLLADRPVAADLYHAETAVRARATVIPPLAQFEADVAAGLRRAKAKAAQPVKEAAKEAAPVKHVAKEEAKEEPEDADDEDEDDDEDKALAAAAAAGLDPELLLAAGELDQDKLMEILDDLYARAQAEEREKGDNVEAAKLGALKSELRVMKDEL
jgi:ubiquinone/menaquinone biosynthesis C-methylase UbiE